MDKYLQNAYIKVKNGAYKFKKEDISAQAKPGNILVKMAYSTCNPHDVNYFNRNKTEGARLGVEGCGEVISAQKKDMIGRKVAFMGKYGTGSNYIELHATDNIIMNLNDKQDLSQAASASVNPLVTMALLHRIKER